MIYYFIKLEEIVFIIYEFVTNDLHSIQIVYKKYDFNYILYNSKTKFKNSIN